MDFLSTIIGAFIGAIGTVIAAVIVTKSTKSKQDSPVIRLPDDVLQQAKELTALKRQLLLSLRKYDQGKRINSNSDSDRDQQQLAVYSVLASDKLVNKILTDSGTTIITLTNRGWKVSAAVDALKK